VIVNFWRNHVSRLNRLLHFLRNRGALGRRGAVYVEFLAVFLPIFFSFWVLLQSAGFYAAKLVTMHAAYLGARAAAVVLPDNPSEYGESGGGGVGKPEGKRKEAIESAVKMGLAANGSLIWPMAEVEVLGADGAKKGQFNREEVVMVRVTVPYYCGLPVADKVICGFGGMRPIRSQATHVIHGADYEYP
jgi:hypothetical protein